jgi:DNA-dependent RNA polymerase auxiliary subunit epsilon
LVNILILRLCNYDKSPDHVESAGKFTLRETKSVQYINAQTREKLTARLLDNNLNLNFLEHIDCGLS